MAYFDQVEQLVEPIESVGQHADDRSLDPSLFHGIADPAVGLGVHDSQIDLYGDVIARKAEVDERAAGSIVSPYGVGGVRLALAELLGQGDQLLQVLLVLDRVLAPLVNQGIEQLGHPVVVLRVEGALINDYLAHVVGDRLGYGLLVSLDPLRQLVERAGALLDDELDEPGVLEVGDDLCGVGLNVGVQQEAHAGLVLLEVEVLAGAELDLVADRRVVGEFRLDGSGFVGGVPGGLHLVSQVGVAARHGCHRLVQIDPLRLVGFELFGVAWLGGAEVLLVLHRAPRRTDRLADGADGLQRLVEVFARLREPVLQQSLDVLRLVAIQSVAGVVGDGVSQRVEQVAVIDDIAVALIVTVQAVHAADGLEQPVVAHGLVDVQVGGGRGVKAGQQFVDYDQQAHLPGMLDETVLDVLLELLDLVHDRVGRLIEVIGQHLPVDLVLPQLLGQACAGILLRDVAWLRLVAGDDCTLASEPGLAEQVVDRTCLVDARADKDGVAAPVHQPGLDLHVKQDVVDDLPRARFGADHLLHGAPAFLEFGTGQIGHAIGLGLEPLVHLGGRGQALIDVAGFVAQVEHHAVIHGLVELVGVDETAERCQAGFFVRLEQGRASEPDEHRAGEQLLHGPVHNARLRPVRLVDEDEDIALGNEALGDGRLKLPDELAASVALIAVTAGAAKLLDK